MSSFALDRNLQTQSIADVRRKIQQNYNADLQTNKKQTKSEYHYNKWRDYDLLTCLIAMVCLLLSITYYEYTFQRMLRAFPKIKVDTPIDQADQE